MANLMANPATNEWLESEKKISPFLKQYILVMWKAQVCANITYSPN